MKHSDQGLLNLLHKKLDNLESASTSIAWNYGVHSPEHRKIESEISDVKEQIARLNNS